MFFKKRELLVKVVIWIIVVAFITTIFAIWGARKTQMSRFKPNAAKVDGSIITKQQYFSQLNNRLKDYRKYYGENLSDTTILNIRKNVMDDLVESVLLRKYASNNDLDATRNEILSGIMQDFRNEDGSIDRKKFMQYKQQIPAKRWRMWEASVARQVKENKVRTVVNDKVTLTNPEIADYYASTKLQVKIQQIYLNPSLLIDTPTIKTFYKDHSDSFIKPEKRFVRHIVVSDTDLANDTQGSVEQIKINNIYNLLREGYDFKNVVEYSDNPLHYDRENKNYYIRGELGWITKRSNVNKRIIEEAFRLQKNEISEPFRTEEGYEIIQVTDIGDTEFFKLDEIANEIRWHLVSDTEMKKLTEKAEKIISDINSKKMTFKDAVKKYSDGLSADSDGIVGYIPRIEIPYSAFSSKYGLYLYNEIPKNFSNKTYYVNSDFSDSVFNLNVNEISKPIKSKLGVHIVKALEYKVPDNLEFKTDFDQTYSTLLRYKQRMVYNDWYEKYHKKMEGDIEILLDKDFFTKLDKSND